MEKLLLSGGLALALAAIVGTGRAQAQLVTPGCTAFSCLQTQANVTNPITTTTTTTTTLANQISAALEGSLLNAGMLTEMTTNTSATGGMGSSFNTASLTGNTIAETPTKAGVGGDVSMSFSMNGGGILQAAQNTGTNAVQQNAMTLTSVGTGGVLSVFSPTAIPVR